VVTPCRRHSTRPGHDPRGQDGETTRLRDRDRLITESLVRRHNALRGCATISSKSLLEDGGLRRRPPMENRGSPTLRAAGGLATSRFCHILGFEAGGSLCPHTPRRPMNAEVAERQTR
jgi:hypothetical protein